MMTDQQIIQLLRTNQTDKALNSLYKHFPMMRKLILSKGGSTEDAEDVFQEALVIFCRKAKEYDFVLTAQLSSYLFSVCNFLWKDEVRKRRPYVSLNIDTTLDKTESEDPGKWVEEDKRIKQAEKVLNELGERCRELLLLFYNGGLRLKDIASKMGYSSEATAKNQKYKCLEAAKNKLKEMKQTIATL